MKNSDGQTTSKPKTLRKRAESIQFVYRPKNNKEIQFVCIDSPRLILSASIIFLSGSPGTIHLPFLKGKMGDHRSRELDKLRGGALVMSVRPIYFF